MMLKKLILENWKSFELSMLYVDPQTILIGTNASGKSNCLDALQFLNRVSQGVGITQALKGEANVAGIRGGVEWAFRKGQSSFALTVECESEDDDRTEFVYRLEVGQFGGRCDVVSESLRRLKFRHARKNRPYEVKLFWTESCNSNDPYITARIYNEKNGTPKELSRSLPIIFQLSQQGARHEVEDGVKQVLKSLQGIFILDPIPSHMRNFSLLSESLESDASNIAGVIAALPDKEQIEETLTTYLKGLPEKDIHKVYAETVGKFRSDAMLYCEESWSEIDGIHTVDARGMSDGSLRFLAIMTALLTRPVGSLLVIEEIDNGLHPSRAGLLLKMLKEIGSRRKIDVLLTTHNPALLDAFGVDGIPFIFVSHRDSVSGVSKITALEEIEPLAKMMASASVGKLSSLGRIEDALRNITGV